MTEYVFDTEHDRYPVAVHVFLTDTDGRVLLMRRAGSGYADGSLGLPAGHVDLGETPTGCAIREVGEELGIEVDPSELHPAGVMFRRSQEPRVDIFFTTSTWPRHAGDPRAAQVHGARLGRPCQPSRRRPGLRRPGHHQRPAGTSLPRIRLGHHSCMIDAAISRSAGKPGDSPEHFRQETTHVLKRALVGLRVIRHSGNHSRDRVLMRESVDCAAVHVELPVCFGPVHFFRERHHIPKRHMGICSTMADQHPRSNRPEIGWRGRAQTSVHAHGAGQLRARARQSEYGHAAEAEPDGGHAATDLRATCESGHPGASTSYQLRGVISQARQARDHPLPIARHAVTEHVTGEDRVSKRRIR